MNKIGVERGRLVSKEPFIPTYLKRRFNMRLELEIVKERIWNAMARLEQQTFVKADNLQARLELREALRVLDSIIDSQKD